MQKLKQFWDFRQRTLQLSLNGASDTLLEVGSNNTSIALFQKDPAHSL